jgi:uncharacterized membrane protein AbrB (regulator of aidB expression)
MGRSIGAVVLGFLYALAFVWLVQMVLWFCLPPGDVQDDETESVPRSRLVLTVVGTFAGAILAGFMTAHVARRAEFTHTLVLGTVLVGALAVTSGCIEADYPAWYRLALPATTLPGALLGALLRARCWRTPPPTPPQVH